MLYTTSHLHLLQTPIPPAQISWRVYFLVLTSEKWFRNKN